MNPAHNLVDVVEMVLTEAVIDVSRDQYIVPGWMLRDLRAAYAKMFGAQRLGEKEETTLRDALEKIVSLGEEADRWHGPAFIARRALRLADK